MPSTIEDLVVSLELSEETAKKIISAGYTIISKLSKLPLCEDFPANLTFMNYHADRISIQVYLRESFGRPQSTVSDLRPILNDRQKIGTLPEPLPHIRPQSRGRRSHRIRYHRSKCESGESSDNSSVSTKSRTRSLSDSSKSRIFKRARNLPLPHKQAPKFVNEKGKRVKACATDLHFDDFLIYSLKTALRLSRSVSGVYQDALTEYLEYLEFLVTRHRDYEDDAVLSFDEEFRAAARFDKFKLSNVQNRGILCDKYFHAKTRRPQTQSLFKTNKKKQLFRGSAGAQRATFSNKGYRFACCFAFQENRCENAAACAFSHICGYCGRSNHSVVNCRSNNSRNTANAAN